MSPKEPPDPKPVVTRNSSEFKLDLYASILQEELVVFAVQVLQADGSSAQVEDVVSICFRFFPHSFALKNYFYWPDSALAVRRLHEAREKGLLKGNPVDGFEVKVQGRKAAKLTAKALGVSFPVPPKPEVVAPVVETPAPVAEKKEEAQAPVKDVRPVAGGSRADKSRVRKKVVKKRAAKPKKKIAKPIPKKKPAPKKKAVQPVLKTKAPVKPVAKMKAKPAPQARAQGKQKRASKKAKAAQPAGVLNPPRAKIKAPAPATGPKIREEARQVAQKAAPVVISKEEKEKAAKVVRQVERSDAFRHYKKNGRKARISEFEFRDMLFTTMETSSETLKRNVDAFKRYAVMRERADLAAFLDFCEEHFAALLKPKAKFKR